MKKSFIVFLAFAGILQASVPAFARSSEMQMIINDLQAKIQTRDVQIEKLQTDFKAAELENKSKSDVISLEKDLETARELNATDRTAVQFLEEQNP